MILEARDIRVRYGAREILSGVSLGIGVGERVGLVGPNGAGKTTLLRVLAGLQSAESGVVELDGKPLEAWRRRAIARRVAVVPQAGAAVYDFTVLEYVLMGAHARAERFALASAADLTRARDALARLEIAELAGHPVNTLSGGERQRAAMARAMVAEAPLWLLDEPTSNLDPRHQVALLAHVRAHTAAGGAALAILHDLNLVERAFPRVLVLHDGRLVADGPTATALDPALVSEVFEVEMRRIGTDAGPVWVAG